MKIEYGTWEDGEEFIRFDEGKFLTRRCQFHGNCGLNDIGKCDGMVEARNNCDFWNIRPSNGQ